MTRMFHAFVERAFTASNVFRNLEEAERWLSTVRATSTSSWPECPAVSGGASRHRRREASNAAGGAKGCGG
jgi:hypothetical protein